MRIDTIELYERPEYIFSFCFLIVLHAAVTMFFATLNRRYLRMSLSRKKAKELRMQKAETEAFGKQFQHQLSGHYSKEMDNGGMHPNERQPLVPTNQLIQV